MTIKDGHFVDATGAPFVPRGANYVRIVNGHDSQFVVGVYDRDRVNADFASLAADGYNTVRMFIDSCAPGPACIASVGEAGLHDAYLANIADVTRLARDNGIVLILTSNDLPDGGNYNLISQRDDSEKFPGYRNSIFLTASGHQAMAAYWTDLMHGLAEQDAAFDAVLGWSILNEEWLFGDQPPLALRSGSVTTASGTYDVSSAANRRAMVTESIRAIIATVSAVIRAQDPTALVTMGFFTPQFPNPTGTGGTWYVDTAPLVEDSDLDFFDFHAYPGGDLGVAGMGENFGITDAKPVVMGELGAFTNLYPDAEAAALAIQRWVADSCTAGFDGWVYWAYDRLPLDDATIGFTDEGNYLRSALSPRSQPDPCVVTLADSNLALGKPARASHQLADQPAKAAFDDDPGTQWGSGKDATQWVEVELGGATVSSVTLTVAQWPAGRTVHVITVWDDAGKREVYRFAGKTAEGDQLVATFDEPLTNVTRLRVTTESSPSWVAWRDISVE